MEDYDMQGDFDYNRIKLADIGDVDVSFGNYKETQKRIVDSVKGVLEKDVIPVSIGGEHTITHGVINAFEKKPVILIFDAHLDFRDDYVGEKFSHACVTRRVTEILGPENVMVVGVRSAEKNELDDAKKMGVKFVDGETAKDNEILIDNILNELRGKDVYLSVDMDVIDPAEARGVCNPVPGGLSYTEFVSSLDFIDDVNIVGLDLVEVSPQYDSYTPVLAANLIMKVLSRIESLKG